MAAMCTFTRHIAHPVQGTEANIELSNVLGTGRDAACHMEDEEGECESAEEAEAEAEEDTPAEGDHMSEWR